MAGIFKMCNKVLIIMIKIIGEQHTYLHISMYMEYVRSHVRAYVYMYFVFSLVHTLSAECHFLSFTVDYLRNSSSAGSGI